MYSKMRSGKKTILFTLALFLLSSISNAQERDFDQIKDEILNAKSERDKLLRLINLGSTYSRQYPDSTLFYADSVAKMDFADPSLAMAGHTFLSALTEYHSSRLQTAIPLFEESANLFSKIDEEKFYFSSLNFLGIACIRTDQLNKAIETFSFILDKELAETPSAQAGVHANLSNAYKRLGDFANAILQLELSIELTNKESNALAFAYMNLSTMYMELEMYEKAITTLLIAKSHLIDPRMEVSMHMNLAQASFEMGNYEEAKTNYWRAINLSKPVNQSRQLITPFLQLTSIYIEENRADSANFYLQKAKAECSDNCPIPMRIQVLLIDMKYQIFIDNNIAALEKGHEIEKFANENNLLIQTKDAFDGIALIYEKLGQPEQALKYKKLQADLYVLSEKDAKNVQIAKARAELQRANQQKILEEERSSKAFYQNLSFQIGTLSGCAILLSLFFYKKFRTQKNQVVLKDSELQELTEQIESVKRENHILPDSFLTLKSKAVLPVAQIVYIKSDGPYVEIYLKTKTKPEVDRNSLKGILNSLPQEGFLQTHRSYIVNIESIRSVYSSRLVLENESEIPISRSFKEDINRIFKAR